MQTTLTIGSRVAGFELTRCVARSAIACVFEGRRGGARAAVKVYAASWTARAERNLREAQAQRGLVHPCVARALDAARRPDGTFVLISEWVEGPSLETRLAHGPLGWPAARSIVRDLARGLGAIHAAGIVHRDLKPSNIMLPTSGEPSAVIIDFGHVLVLDDERLTETGHVLGSAHYMAPEQAQGLPIGPRVDLYAVGVVLYRMLTGALPFDHWSPAEVMRMHQQEPVPPPRSRARIPAAVEDLCLWLLAKSPAQRVPNAHVLRLTLEAIAATATTLDPAEVRA